MISVIWQVIWPILLYSVITAIIAVLGVSRLDIIWTMALSAFVTSLILGSIYNRRRQSGHRYFGPSWRVRLPAGSKAVLLFVLASALCIFLNNLIALSGIALISDGFEEVSENIFGVSLWQQVLAVGLAAPVVEELIFRGMGYEKLRSAMGILPAALISSLIFALYHGNLVQAVYGFFVGLVLALVYEMFGGLTPAIWLHVCANLTSIALTLLSGLYPAFFEGDLYTAGGTIITGLLVSCCLLIIYIRRHRLNR